jgi:NADP-dependent 3-hydroxy acid dehydrogenase YdfG
LPVSTRSISVQLGGPVNQFTHTVYRTHVLNCIRTEDVIMNQHLDGTVALVTGASSGIGEATALALADSGAAVALIARRGDLLDQLKDRIAASGGTAAAFVADIADRKQAESAVQQVVTDLGRLDIVVNNAGLMRIGAAAESDPADWEEMLSVNVQGLLYVTRASLPHLIRAAADAPRRVADVVSISSTAGRVARPGNAVYALTKFGIGAFSEAVRQEVLGQRVRVGLVEPGTVQTEITTALPPDVQATLEKRTEGMVKLEPADIADAVVYMVTRDRRVAVNEILVRSAEQTW